MDKRQASPSEQHLITLLGLNDHELHPVLDKANKFYTKTPYRFISTPSPKKSERYNDNVISKITSDIRILIEKKSPPHAQQHTIKTITLFFIPSSKEDENRLLLSFFPFAKCVRVPNHIKTDLHTSKKTEQYFNAIQNMVRNHVKPMIFKKIDSRLLPLINFKIPPHGETLQNFFFNSSKNDGNVEFNDDHLCVKKFTKEHFNTLQNNETRRYFVDCRGLCFPPNKSSENHGKSHYISPKLPKNITNENRIYLSGIYRFGTLVEHISHYDVQYPRKRRLHNETFTCCRSGEIKCSGTHANIFLNDKVIKKS